MGQILSDEGDQEEAINCLIDALRWDSKKGYALLMMGNIFVKFKDDVTTASKKIFCEAWTSVSLLVPVKHLPNQCF